MSDWNKNDDAIFQASVTKNGVPVDISTDLVELIYEVYDSAGVQIQKFATPTKVDHDPITVSGTSAIFKVFSSNLAGKTNGDVKFVRRLSITDTDFPDNLFNDNEQTTGIITLKDAI